MTLNQDQGLSENTIKARSLRRARSWPRVPSLQRQHRSRSHFLQLIRAKDYQKARSKQQTTKKELMQKLIFLRSPPTFHGFWPPNHCFQWVFDGFWSFNHIHKILFSPYTIAFNEFSMVFGSLNHWLQQSCTIDDGTTQLFRWPIHF